MLFLRINSNARVRENTISSFKSAVLNGAHLIEFDVQLTNDLIPIVYHDQNVLLEVQTKMEKQIKKMIFPFHKLTYEELKDFKVTYFIFVLKYNKNNKLFLKCFYR